jgi:hypothetical protein
MTSRIRSRITQTPGQLHGRERHRSHYSHHSAHLPFYHPPARLSSKQTTQTWTSLLDRVRDKGLGALTEIVAGIHTLLHPFMVISPAKWRDLPLVLRQLDTFATVVQCHIRRINPDDR